MFFHALPLPRFAEDSRAHSAQQEEIPDKRDDVELWKSMSCHDYWGSGCHTFFSIFMLLLGRTCCYWRSVSGNGHLWSAASCLKKFIFCFRETPSMKRSCFPEDFVGPRARKVSRDFLVNWASTHSLWMEMRDLLNSKMNWSPKKDKTTPALPK